MINPDAIERTIEMKSWLAFPKVGLPSRPRLGLLALTLVLVGCGQSSSDDSLGTRDSAGDKAAEAAEGASTGFVSDAPIKAAQQTMDLLEKQKLLQVSQTQDADGARSEQSPAETEAMLKAAAAKTDETLKQAADDAAKPGQVP